MYRLLLALVIFSSGLAEARVLFNPVVSTVARTLPEWQVGFQKTGGANINSDLLANALSVGVLPRLEIGVVPLFYATAPGSRNYTGKFNFFRGEQFDWAASFTENRFRSVQKNSDENPDMVLRSTQLAVNYHPEGEDYMLSSFATHTCGHLDSTNVPVFVKSLECKVEYGADVQWRLKDREWITFAYGFVRDAGRSPYEELNSGMGVAWSTFRPNEMFSRPSLGVYHTPATGNTLYLISTTFYEL